MNNLTKILLPTLAISFGIFTNCFAGYEEKIVATNGSGNDNFGESVSISGDYAIVGAKQNDDVGNDSGSAYIFKRSGTAWTQQAKLTANDAASGDWFGESVSISGDYAIVGVRKDDDGGSSSGSAYIFKRSGTAWTQQAKITANDAASNDIFGYSVSISGDYVIIGTPFDDDGFTDNGSAYIFKRSGAAWTQQAKITANDAASSEYFGYSVSISGDYVIIGTPLDGGGSGSAYIFKRSGASWTQQAKIMANDAAPNDYFGARVSISGDYAIAGARNNDDGGSNSGSAYIFKRSGTAWTQQTKINANDAAAGDQFGYSVSISENYTVVGAWNNDDGGSNSGSAYIFKRSGTAWTQQTKINANDAAAGDQFGYSVSISGNYTVVGANKDDDGGSNSGSAYIYGSSPIVNGDVSQIVNSNSTFSFNDGANVDTGMDIAFTGVSGSATIQCESFAEAPTGNDGFGTGNVQPIRWVITDGGLTFSNAEIRIDTTSLPFSLSNPSNAAIFHRSTPGSGTFTQLSTSLIGSELVANTATFSEFALGGGDGSLPIELTSFEAEPFANGIRLFWETETETNNLGFKIYRSTSENGDFREVASHSTEPNLRGQINSTFPTNYQWADTEVENGKKYYYYISDIDLDGVEVRHTNKMTSATANLFDDTRIIDEFILEQNFPNPFNPSTTINFQIAKEQSVKLEVYNLKGELVKELVNEKMNKGSYSANWNGTDSFGNQVSSGTYFYKISAGTFTQTNKMILLK